jgi:hypothetical protein
MPVTGEEEGIEESEWRRTKGETMRRGKKEREWERESAMHVDKEMTWKKRREYAERRGGEGRWEK